MNQLSSNESGSDTGRRGGHGWMMVVCCIPMLVLAVTLAATGVASAGFLLAALMCTAMMALMMRGMGGTTRDSR